MYLSDAMHLSTRANYLLRAAIASIGTGFRVEENVLLRNPAAAGAYGHQICDGAIIKDNVLAQSNCPERAWRSGGVPCLLLMLNFLRGCCEKSRACNGPINSPLLGAPEIWLTQCLKEILLRVQLPRGCGYKRDHAIYVKKFNHMVVAHNCSVDGLQMPLVMSKYAMASFLLPQKSSP